MAFNESKSPTTLPQKILSLTLIVTLAIILALGWFNWNSHEYLQRNLEAEGKLRDLSSSLVYLDEVMTMSVRLAVSTDGTIWSEHYYATELQIGKKINEIKKIAPEIFIKEKIAELDNSNNILASLEHNALRLMRAGDRTAAADLVFGEQYENEKKSYSSILGQIVSRLEDRTKTLYEENNNKAKWEEIIIGLSLLLLLVFTIFSLRMMKRYTAQRIHAEKKYQNIFENSVEGVFQSSTEGKFLLVNPAMVRIFGYDSAEEMVSAITDISRQIYVDQNGREEFKRLLEENGEVSGFEVQVYRKDGKIICISENTRLVRDENGKELYYEGTIEDITKRKKADEKLRLLLRSVEQSPASIVITDTNGIIEYVNPKFTSVTGYTAQEVIGRNPRILKSGKTSSQEYTQLWETIKSGQEWRGVFCNRKKNGEFYWEDASISGVTDETGTVKNFIAVKEDITERKLAEEKILILNRLYSFISQINQIIVRTRDQGKLFNEVCKIAVDYGKFRMAWIGLIDKKTSEIVPVDHYGYENNYLSEIKRISINNKPEGRGPTGTAVREGKVFFCNDIQNDSKMIPWREQAVSRGYRSSVALPITVHGEIIGVFTLYASETNFFNDEEIELLTEVTGDISFALNAIRIEEQQKQAEDALRESEERYRSVVSAMVEGIVLQNANGVIITANESACEILSLTFDQMMGRTSVDPRWQAIREDGSPFPGEEHPAMLTLQTGKSFSNVIMGLNTPDDKLKWISINTRPLFNPGIDKPYAVVSSFADVTDRKKAAEALKESETKFRAIFENSVDAIVVTKANHFLFGNKAFYTLFGYTNENELEGKSILNIVPSSQQDRAKVVIRNLIKGGFTRHAYEFRGLRKDGSEFDMDVHVSGYELRGKSYLVGVLRDITERKNSEREILKEKKKAEEANRLKSSFLANMSHEIRTPLNAVLGHSSIIKEQFYEGSDEETKISFNSIDDACNRLLSTITKILDVSRVEAGEFLTDIKPLSLDYIAKSVYQDLRPLAEERNIPVIFNVPDAQIMVKGDDYCLRGAIINILHNAIKFSHKGLPININISLDEKYGICSITDQGIGMSESYLKNLFEEFSQEVLGYTRKYEGTGLGLALTKKYIELMNGEIEVQSQKDVGTTVTFKVPLYKK